MSILIPGMKLPENYKRMILMENGDVTDLDGTKIARAIELPPHGRLGDLDALSKSLDGLCDRVCQYSKAQRKAMCGSCPLGHAFAVVEDDAPTIIPADQEMEDVE